MKKSLALLICIMVIAVSRVFCEENLFYSSSTLKERTHLLEEYKNVQGERVSSVKGLLFEKMSFERVLCSDSLLGQPPTEDNPKDLVADKKAIPILLFALENDPSWEVRETIAKYLNKYQKDKTIIKALKTRLNDRNEKVKLVAAKTLINWNKKDERVIDVLIRIWRKSSNRKIQLEALFALPNFIKVEKGYLSKEMNEEKNPIYRFQIATILYNSEQNKNEVNDIYVQELVRFIGEIPGIPPYDINLYATKDAISVLNIIISKYPDKYIKDKMFIEKIEDIIKKRESSNKGYSKAWLDELRKLLKKLRQ